jgi:excinuclease UvrABC nuclease subunit
MGEFTELLENWDDVGLEHPYADLEPPELSKFKDVTLLLNSGVYVLLRGIVIVYVGQAECFATRINHHRGAKKIKFDGIKIFPCKHKGRRLAIERELIRKYNPKWNVKDRSAPSQSLAKLMEKRWGKLRLVVNNEGPMRRF